MARLQIDDGLLAKATKFTGLPRAATVEMALALMVATAAVRKAEAKAKAEARARARAKGRARARARRLAQPTVVAPAAETTPVG